MATLVCVTGCGQKAAQADKPDAPAATAVVYRDLPEQLEDDGTTISVGNPDASRTFLFYEDPRCPYCKEFEVDGGAELIENQARKGDLKVQYTLASFLDDRLGGHGSLKAVNALRAALEEGKFIEYHDVLYANQPAEEVDGFTDAFLLKLAAKVPGLRGEEFDNAVKKVKYRDFVEASQQAYETAGAPGTPTLLIDGVSLPDSVAGFFFDKDSTRKVIAAFFPQKS
ncbi:DsbA family protein [Streptomyces sp. NPDC088261]|uniref:DsbA family protein n=1 Tax=Streptomyces sp. NPDC088261 TaxID=3365851 RepID=UPI003803286A